MAGFQDIPYARDLNGDILTCWCFNDCQELNTTCKLREYAKCFKMMFINEEGEEITRAGCLPPTESHIDQCSKYAMTTYEQTTVIECCNNGSLCNQNLDVESTFKLQNTDQSALTTQDQEILIGVLVACSIFALLAILVMVIYRLRLHCREQKRLKQIKTQNNVLGCPVLYGGGGKPYKPKGGMNMINELENTSSGSGMPLLVQRTIANQIEIVKEIGQGRYGTVMLGKWREEKKAVKIFNSTDEDSWHRETEIYQTVLLRHENILGFIASDICGAHSWTQLYLITDYHENGSLHDYLQKRNPTLGEAIKLAHTAAAGLAHLHADITGTQGKPAIAHRDVKSKNILVKNNGQCCIADMGLAVTYSKMQGKVDMGSYDQSRRKGTIRYMSPEVLNETMPVEYFDAYKASDVYGFALVMWEIINATVIDGQCEDYKLPYHNLVPLNPSFDDMKAIVVVNNYRPVVNASWWTHKVVSPYVSTMMECWSFKPESRLSMLRVRKNLHSLREGNPNKKKKHHDCGQTSSSDSPGSSSDSSSLEKKMPVASTTNTDAS